MGEHSDVTLFVWAKQLAFGLVWTQADSGGGVVTFVACTFSFSLCAATGMVGKNIAFGKRVELLQAFSPTQPPH